jgi:hypothetical protein
MLKNLLVYRHSTQLLFDALIKLIFVVLFSASSTEANEADKFDFVDQIGNWGLFEDDDTCWMAASAWYSLDKNLNLEEQMLYVTFFNGFAEPKISFFVPDCCNEDATAKTQHDEMMLVWFEDFYYPNRKNDDEKLLMSLMSSENVAVISDATKKPLLVFSLSGIRAAYSEVARTCDFRPVRMLRDDDNVYKG